MGVYFILCDALPPLVKIGASANIEKRVQSINTATPFEVRIIAHFEDETERDLHKKFEHLRYNKEWFKYTDEIKEFINSKEDHDFMLAISKVPINHVEYCLIQLMLEYPQFIHKAKAVLVDYRSQLEQHTFLLKLLFELGSCKKSFDFNDFLESCVYMISRWSDWSDFNADMSVEWIRRRTRLGVFPADKTVYFDVLVGRMLG